MLAKLCSNLVSSAYSSRFIKKQKEFLSERSKNKVIRDWIRKYIQDTYMESSGRQDEKLRCPLLTIHVTKLLCATDGTILIITFSPKNWASPPPTIDFVFKEKDYYIHKSWESINKIIKGYLKSVSVRLQFVRIVENDGMKILNQYLPSRVCFFF